MLSLTRREQIVLALVLCALVAGAGIRHLRMMQELPAAQSMRAQTR